MDRQGSRSFFNHYPSLEHALRDLYPEYPWDSSKFVGSGKIPSGYWKDQTNVVKALEQIEKQMGIKEVRNAPFNETIDVVLMDSIALAKGLVFCHAHGTEGIGVPFVCQQVTACPASGRQVSIVSVGEGLSVTREICTTAAIGTHRKLIVSGECSWFIVPSRSEMISGGEDHSECKERPRADKSSYRRLS